VDQEVEKFVISHVATFSRSEDDVSGAESAVPHWEVRTAYRKKKRSGMGRAALSVW
jgi:hypothetical protein